MSGKDFLDTVQGELSFFHALTQARPVGKHRHFHALSIRTSILHDTGRHISIDDIWNKIRECYNVDSLESYDLEADMYDDELKPIPEPEPEHSLDAHPFFREEFVLPEDEEIDNMILSRRKRQSPSPPSSPPLAPERKRPRGKKGPASAAGLVGGSDSSVLTSESGDEDERMSVKTGTEAPPTEGEEESDRKPSKSTRSKTAATSKKKGRPPTRSKKR